MFHQTDDHGRNFIRFFKQGICALICQKIKTTGNINGSHYLVG